MFLFYLLLALVFLVLTVICIGRYQETQYLNRKFRGGISSCIICLIIALALFYLAFNEYNEQKRRMLGLKPIDEVMQLQNPEQETE